MKSISFNSNSIKGLISARLADTLSKDKFIYKKTSNEFVSIRGEFSFIFNLLQTAWSNHYSLNVRLFISVKKVESIYEKIVGKSHKLTLGNEIGQIFKSPDGRKVINGDLSILLFQDEDIDAAVETLKGYYEKIASPYFEKYSTMNALDDIINNPPFEYCPAHVGGNFDERCMKGLIIARLAQNSSYENLVSIYDEKIKKTQNIESIENYYRVRDYLMYNRL